MRKKKVEPPLDIPPGLKRRLRLVNIGICAVVASTTAALGWAWTHPVPPMPLPPLSVPVYWGPALPIHTPRVLATTMGAAFGAVIAGHLDIAYPLVHQAARRFRRPSLASHHWAWGIFAPALRQSTMRAAAFTAGVIGILL